MHERLRARLKYLRGFGRLPDLENPRLFSEKVVAAKLTWRSPMMPILADKVRVKEVVSQRLGADWVTPSLFSGPELPPRDRRDWPLPLVIKANHGCGYNLFLKEERDKQWPRIEREVRRWLAGRYGAHEGEWHYTDIVPQVLVEPMIGGSIPSTEYKFFCFGGRVEFIEVHLRRGDLRECANMDRDWNLHPFTLLMPRATTPPPRPQSLEEMIRGAEVLAEGFPFVRIDLYEVDGRPRFGEVTFYPASGRIKPDPPEYDRIYGDLWPPGLPADRAEGAGSRSIHSRARSK